VSRFFILNGLANQYSPPGEVLLIKKDVGNSYDKLQNKLKSIIFYLGRGSQLAEILSNLFNHFWMSHEVHKGKVKVLFLIKVLKNSRRANSLT